MNVSKPIERLKDAIKTAENAKARLNVAASDHPDIAKWSKVIEEFNYAITILEGGCDTSAAGILVEMVRTWATERDIIGDNAGATIDSQYDKLIEEIGELANAIADKDQNEIVDGIGDCTVVLINLAELAGTSFEKCLAAAYEEIKDRKGKMIDGKYVKETAK